MWQERWTRTAGAENQRRVEAVFCTTAVFSDDGARSLHPGTKWRASIWNEVAVGRIATMASAALVAGQCVIDGVERDETVTRYLDLMHSNTLLAVEVVLIVVVAARIAALVGYVEGRIAARRVPIGVGAAISSIANVRACLDAAMAGNGVVELWCVRSVCGWRYIMLMFFIALVIVGIMEWELFHIVKIRV